MKLAQLAQLREVWDWLRKRSDRPAELPKKFGTWRRSSLRRDSFSVRASTRSAKPRWTWHGCGAVRFLVVGAPLEDPSGPNRTKKVTSRTGGASLRHMTDRAVRVGNRGRKAKRADSAEAGVCMARSLRAVRSVDFRGLRMSDAVVAVRRRGTLLDPTPCPHTRTSPPRHTTIDPNFWMPRRSRPSSVAPSRHVLSSHGYGRAPAPVRVERSSACPATIRTWIDAGCPTSPVTPPGRRRRLRRRAMREPCDFGRRRKRVARRGGLLEGRDLGAAEFNTVHGANDDSARCRGLCADGYELAILVAHDFDRASEDALEAMFDGVISSSGIRFPLSRTERIDTIRSRSVDQAIDAVLVADRQAVERSLRLPRSKGRGSGRCGRRARLVKAAMGHQCHPAAGRIIEIALSVKTTSAASSTRIAVVDQSRGAARQDPRRPPSGRPRATCDRQRMGDLAVPYRITGRPRVTAVLRSPWRSRATDGTAALLRGVPDDGHPRRSRHDRPGSLPDAGDRGDHGDEGLVVSLRRRSPETCGDGRSGGRFARDISPRALATIGRGLTLTDQPRGAWRRLGPRTPRVDLPDARRTRTKYGSASASGLASAKSR